ncbi:hypothetical protein D3C85_1676790 [compost metagenome]
MPASLVSGSVATYFHTSVSEPVETSLIVRTDSVLSLAGAVFSVCAGCLLHAVSVSTDALNRTLNNFFIDTS